MYVAGCGHIIPISRPSSMHVQKVYICGKYFYFTTSVLCVFPEIVTTTGSHFVSFDSAEERDGWIESIRKASVRQ